ncbi:MAG: hypothetical protein JWQ86_2908, partial [Mycobacterium sp.]|nr:hypothetical protein [Mycobacterium sp.]
LANPLMPRKACGTDHPRHVLSLPPPAARPHRCGRALAAAVPAAHADSIFLRQGRRRPADNARGSRDHRVTTAGGYTYASLVDDGRILALHGKRLQNRIDSGLGL